MLDSYGVLYVERVRNLWVEVGWELCWVEVGLELCWVEVGWELCWVEVWRELCWVEVGWELVFYAPDLQIELLSTPKMAECSGS